MKAILEFSLPDDQEEYETASNASKYRYVLTELSEHLRRRVKYAPDNQLEEVTLALEGIRDMIYELLRQDNVTL